MNRKQEPIVCARIRYLVLACAGFLTVGPRLDLDAAAPVGVVQKAIANLRFSDKRTSFTPLHSADTGIHFTNHVSIEALAQNRLIEDGSGVAAGDVDADGLCDLYFCNLEGNNRLFRNIGGLRFEDITRRAGLQCPGQASTGAVFADVDGDGDLDLLVNGLGTGTRLFLNDGRGQFVEKADAGLLRDTGARSLALADIDGDGTVDLYVTHYRRTTSRDEPQRVRITRRGAGFEVPAEFRERFSVEADDRGGAVLIELGEPDVLYRNKGGGRFEVISWTEGNFLDDHGRALSQPPRDWGLSAMFRDLNGDAAPDLYVCNDFHSPDRLWINDGKGRFRAAPASALRKTSWASMAIDFADIDRDGSDDFFIADMLGVTRARRQVQRDNLQGNGIPSLGWGWGAGEIAQITSVMRNTLFLNLGGGNFAEIAQYSGLQASDWTWGAAFLDVDLDGFEDLLIANGHARDHLNSDIQSRLATFGPPRNAGDRAALFRQIPPLAVPKRAFRNRGDLTFEDCSEAWGFDWVGISTGMALADLDNDGDMDVALNNLEAGALIMRNDSTAPRVAVRTQGQPPNTAAIGAKIRVLAPGLPPQTQEIIGGGRYLSGDDPIRTFAAGTLTNLIGVEVTWRSGQQTRTPYARANQVILFTEPPLIHPPTIQSGAEPITAKGWFGGLPPPRASDQPGLGTQGAVARGVEPLFEDATELLNLTHSHEPFDDLARQPLLPRKLSHNGPGVSWIDLNGDGHEDLVIPGSRRKAPQIRLNDGTGKFSTAPPSVFSMPSRGDQTTILSWFTGPGSGLIVTGISGYEMGTNLPASLGVYLFSAKDIRAIAGHRVGVNVGPVAAADIDADGDLDLFVGGQAEPGRYPVASRSVVLRNADGRFGEDVDNTARLANAGLVNGAVWSDIDGDGFPELILACEWGPIRIFQNDRGQLREWDPAISGSALRPNLLNVSALSQFVGWWNGVAVGDFNGDGRLDIVASNWGSNNQYNEFMSDGLRLYHGDPNADGTWEVIETYWERRSKKEVPRRDFLTMSRAYPPILERYNTCTSYAAASVQEIFGPALDRMKVLRAVTLESVLLLNLGDRFEVRLLPPLAQLAPAFAPAVADFDGDGAADVFLSQNSFATDRETGRLDCGRGLLLRGDGAGNFKAMSPAGSGLALSGEQRGAAVADFDEDGRPDLAVAQTSASTKLFRNRGARAGLRVRLVGSSGNRSGIGAQVRLKFGGHYGPVSEIHAGAGYWSQDSSVIVLANPLEPTDVWIRWPGGTVTESALPPGKIEISIDPTGRIL